MALETVPRSPSSVEDLQRAAVWARHRFEIHWSCCRSRRTAWCQTCEDLDLAAEAAENLHMLEASRG